MVEQTNPNIERFESLLRSTERAGMDSLMEFIRKSDFYTAPASTRYHSCHEGGLLEHTLNVYDRLVSKFNDELWNYLEQQYLREVTFFEHLLCVSHFSSTN